MKSRALYESVYGFSIIANLIVLGLNLGRATPGTRTAVAIAVASGTLVALLLSRRYIDEQLAVLRVQLRKATAEAEAIEDIAARVKRGEAEISMGVDRPVVN